MKSSAQNPETDHSAEVEFEQTLRLIASLPAPEGLAERVQAGLKAAGPQKARLLAWPTLRLESVLDSGWVRSAAAAALVAVVVGGGWGIASRVQPAQTGRTIVLPPRVGTSGGFSNAGAMRTPQTLNGPVVTSAPAVHSPTPAPAKAAEPEKKLKSHHGKSTAAGKEVISK
jgi:hypothetical protein